MFARLLNRSTRHRPLICLLLVGLLATGTGVRPASAQQPAPIVEERTARRDTTTAPRVERKSPNRALLYSLGGTAVLTPAFGVGLIVGPSFGHFYADASQQAWIGIGLRTVGGGVFLGGVANEVGEEITAPCFKGCSGQSSAENGFDVNAAMVFGALLVGGSAIYDIATAPGSAREYNEAHGLSAKVMPTVGPRGEQVGLSLRVSF